MIYLSDLLGGGGWRSRVYITSGVFSPPSTVTPVEVIVIGGGQAGSQTDTAGAVGGNSAFGGTVASGGADTVGYGKRVHLGLQWNAGDYRHTQATGAPGFLGIGAGGSAAVIGGYATGSGGASGAVATYSGIPGSTAPITVTVGAGGGAGNMQGSSGAVIVSWRD